MSEIRKPYEIITDVLIALGAFSVIVGAQILDSWPPAIRAFGMFSDHVTHVIDVIFNWLGV